jgi:hypothetical protein
MKTKDHIKKAVHAHSTFTTWACVKELLESGNFYSSKTDRDRRRVLKIVKEAMRKELAEYDVEAEMVLCTSKAPGQTELSNRKELIHD